MEFPLDLVIYLVGLAATAGTILSRITTLEKKGGETQPDYRAHLPFGM